MRAPFRAIIRPLQQPVGGVGGTFPVMVRGYAKPGPQNRDCIQTLANDYIGTRMAALIGLPVPPHTILNVDRATPDGPYFATLDFAPGGGHRPLHDANECAQTEARLSTGVVLFDILIANPDRHANNISVDLRSNPRHFWIFDHGHSLLGHVQGQGKSRLADLSGRLGCTGGIITRQHRHVLIDSLENDLFFDQWITRIEQIPDYQIDDICFTEFDIGIDYSERENISTFLKDRRVSLRNLIANNRNEFRGIKQWSLPNTGSGNYVSAP